ncbi:hypothetical protein COOONC_26562 [Cooperia oncophora]
MRRETVCRVDDGWNSPKSHDEAHSEQSTSYVGGDAQEGCRKCLRRKMVPGRDEKERNHWVRALEGVIRDCGGYRKTPKNKESAAEALKRKITEADQHLSDIILQVKGLESLKEHASEKERRKKMLTISSPPVANYSTRSNTPLFCCR